MLVVTNNSAVFTNEIEEVRLRGALDFRDLRLAIQEPKHVGAYQFNFLQN